MSIAPEQAIAVSELSLGELLSAALVGPDQISDEDAMGWTGLHLARLIAETSDIDHADVWHTMTHMPAGYLRFLESPEGWVALGALVSRILDVPGEPISPVLN